MRYGSLRLVQNSGNNREVIQRKRVKALRAFTLTLLANVWKPLE